MRHQPSCALAMIALAFTTNSAFAEGDPFATGQILEINLGGEVILNTLQDQLTTPNNSGSAPFPVGPTVQSTDILDLGSGGRIDLSYSQTVFGDRRGFVELSFSETSGSGAFIGSEDSFPGSYDDGFRLPAGNPIEFDFDHRSTILAAGASVATFGGIDLSAGLQLTLLEQEANGLNVANDRTFLIEGENRMFGVFGRATHYTALADNRGLRVVGTLGLHANSYEYSYDTSSSLYLPPDQSIRQSGDNGVVSAGLSVQYEHGLTERTWLTAEFGYEGYYGVMNGFDTFIDPHGTSGSASIDRDHIGSLHLTIGVAHRF